MQNRNSQFVVCFRTVCLLFRILFFCFVLFIRRGHLSRGTWTFLFLFCLLFVTTKKHLFFFSLFTLKTELAQHCQLLIFVLDFLSVSAGSGNRIGRGRGLLGRGCQPFSSLIFYTIAKIKKPCCRALIFDFWIRLSYTCFVSLTSVFTQRF